MLEYEGHSYYHSQQLLSGVDNWLFKMLYLLHY